ncbi:MAG TPA: insulinase family protein [Planctomycetaceae bacterium]|nr:insulinase family protein [Planctomycetaceae bacterium]
MEFRSHKLENGLEVVAEVNPAAYSSAVGFFVETGSRDETTEVAGVSHFLEHMVFKGTSTRSADDVNREFDELGAHYNACTSEENTVFYAAMLPEYQAAIVALLGDILRPSLRREDFDMEKKVILEEISMYEDMPPFGADDKCRAAFFGNHPLGRSVLGTVESITNLTVDAMRDYFGRNYVPDKVVLVATGRVDFDALVEVASHACGNWPAVAVRRDAPPFEPVEQFLVVEKPMAAQQYAIALSAAPAAESRDRYAAKMLATILGDDLGSRLYWELVDPGLAEHASIAHCEFQGAGAMMTYLCCDPEDIDDNLRRVEEVFYRAEQEGVTVEELRQAKNKVRSRAVLSSERPRGRLFMVGTDWLARREYLSIAEELDLLEAITLDEINAVLRMFPLSRNTTMTIGPRKNVLPPKR